MRLHGEAATAALGEMLAGEARAGDVITLSGPLGVGKTALARGFIAALGHEGEVPSPSFAIVQPYEELAFPVWHVDLYRIEDPGELEELALGEGRDEAALLIEWPERLGEALWADALRLSLGRAPDGGRALTAEVPPAWGGRWPPR